MEFLTIDLRTINYLPPNLGKPRYQGNVTYKARGEWRAESANKQGIMCMA